MDEHAVEVVLQPGAGVVVGRSAGCDVVVDDPRISRRHLVVEAGGPARWRARDPGSRNGTFRGGARVEGVDVDGAGPVLLHLGGADGVAVLLVPPPPPGGATSPVGGAPEHRSGARGGPGPGPGPVGLRVRLGRDPDNDVVLDHPTASGHHAELTWTPAGIEVVDLASRNGVFVDGRRVRRAAVAVGEVLTLGALDVRVEAAGARVLTPAAAGGVLVEAVTVRVGARELLHDVSASIPAGRLTAVVGPSGAGKSTLMGVLTGATTPASGRVLVDGHDVARAGAALRARVGVVPQDDVLHTGLTVAASLAFSARLRMPPETTAAQRAAEVDRVLAALHLTEHAATRISRLSGGQRRRMNAASELLTRPSLLVLDEPTSGLDPHLERLIMSDLAALAATGTTVVVITHSAATLHLADTVLAVSGGRLVYSGPPDALPAHFGARGLGTVFAEIGGDAAARWADLWEEQADAAGEDAGSGPRVDVVPLPRRVRARRQVRVLAARHLRLLAAERASLLLLLAQAPALGLLSRLFPLPGGFDPGAARGTDVRTLLLVLVLSATWLGTFASVRQVVDERRIVERERAAGVSSLRYLLATSLVLGALVVVQVASLLAVALVGRGLPRGRVVPGPGVELALVLVLTGWAAVAVGLLTSTLARSGAAAAALAPLVVIPQMLLCGGLTRVDRHPWLDAATRLVSARAGFSAAASSVGLPRLERAGARAVAAGAPPPAAPAAWTGTAAHWGADVAELAGLGLAAWVVAWLVLRRGPSAR